MPYAAASYCTRPSCPELRPCRIHGGESRRLADRHRGSARARGYTTTWDRLRLLVLHEEPLCFYHQQIGELVAATTVDHKTPKIHGGTDARANLCGACAHCNYSKGDRFADEFIVTLKQKAARQ